MQLPRGYPWVLTQLTPWLLWRSTSSTHTEWFWYSSFIRLALQSPGM